MVFTQRQGRQKIDQKMHGGKSQLHSEVIDMLQQNLQEPVTCLRKEHQVVALLASNEK